MGACPICGAGASGNEIKASERWLYMSQHGRSSATSYSLLCLRGNDFALTFSRNL